MAHRLAVLLGTIQAWKVLIDLKPFSTHSNAWVGAVSYLKWSGFWKSYWLWEEKEQREGWKRGESVTDGVWIRRLCCHLWSDGSIKCCDSRKRKQAGHAEMMTGSHFKPIVNKARSSWKLQGKQLSLFVLPQSDTWDDVISENQGYYSTIWHCRAPHTCISKGVSKLSIYVDRSHLGATIGRTGSINIRTIMAGSC